MIHAVCPLCETRISFEHPIILCDQIFCPGCHQQLEFSRSNPIELMITTKIFDGMDDFFDKSTYGEYLGETIELF